MAFEWLRSKLECRKQEIELRKQNPPNVKPEDVLPNQCPFCEQQADWAAKRLKWSPTLEKWVVTAVCKLCRCVVEIAV